MHAIRTGAWIAGETFEGAVASGDDVGRTFPIACKSGRPSITPAPRKKDRRGIIQLFRIISDTLFGVETISKRKAGRDLLHQDRGAILIGFKRLHRVVDHALVEPV